MLFDCLEFSIFCYLTDEIKFIEQHRYDALTYFYPDSVNHSDLKKNSQHMHKTGFDEATMQRKNNERKTVMCSKN